MRHRLLLRRAMPLPPPPSPSPAPRTPGLAGGRLFSSLPPPPPLLQSRREVHVWYLLPDELNDASQLKMYMDLLSPSERKNALSMNGEKLQKGCAIPCTGAHHTLEILDTDCKVDPRSFEFKKNKFGKPEILWESDDSRMKWPLHFNISHTSSLIACGITMDTPIGIDIEEKKRKPARNILSLARRYFTPSEVDYLAEIPDTDVQQKEFLKIWTLKEAYVKALGRGFSGAPFNKFSIVLAAKNGIEFLWYEVFLPLSSGLSSSMCATCIGALPKYVGYAFEHNFVMSENRQTTKVVLWNFAPKVFKDSDSGCDCLSENWQFALAELNSSHYMAICVEDDSRSSDSGNGRLPLGLKVWKTVPFLEDTLVSGTEAVTLIS